MSTSSEAAPDARAAHSRGRQPFAITPEGVVVTIRLTPRARRAGIEGIAEMPGPRGTEAALAVRVAAPPVDGAANAALLQLLAKTWRLPQSSLRLEAGASGRVKRVLVRGDSASILNHISLRTETK